MTLLAAAVTAGSVLGLTAAAAVRWLNGGDFLLFPPAHTKPQQQRHEKTTRTTRTQQQREQREERSAATMNSPFFSSENDQLQQQYSTTVDDTSTDEAAAAAASHHLAESHSETLQTLQDTVRIQSEQQDQLLRRLEDVLDRDQQRQRTDATMDLLKANNNKKATARVTELDTPHDTLRGIRDVLTTALLRRQDDNDDEARGDEEERLAVTLDKLDAVLDQIKSDGYIIRTTTSQTNDSTPDDHPVSTKETAATTNIFSGSTPTTPTTATTTPSANLGGDNDHQPLAEAILRLVRDNAEAARRTGSQLLYLYTVNVASHPRVPRYRKIFTSNESFQKHVAGLRGASELLEAVGFVPVFGDDGGGEAKSSSSSSGDPTTATAAAYWEWLPPSIHNKQQEKDEPKPSPQNAWLGDSEAFYLQRLKMAAAALGILKSPSSCGSVDMEALAQSTGLGELLWATGEPTTNSSSGDGTTTIVNDNSIVSTPYRSEIRTETLPRQGEDDVDDEDAGVNCTPTVSGRRNHHHPSSGGFGTPDTGSIMSPPPTKKHLSLSSDFPSLVDPLVMDSSSAPERSFLSPPSPCLNVLEEQGESYETTPSRGSNSPEGTPGSSSLIADHTADTSSSSEAAMWK